jgi:hypothetical protein
MEVNIIKKLLSILGAVGICATSSASVVACGPSPEENTPLPDPIKPEDSHSLLSSFNLDQDVIHSNDFTDQEKDELGLTENDVVYDLTKDADGSQHEFDIKQKDVAELPMYTIIMNRLALRTNSNNLEFSEKQQDLLNQRFKHIERVHYAVWNQIDQSNPEEVAKMYFYHDAGTYFGAHEELYFANHYQATVRFEIGNDFLKALPDEKMHEV